MAENAGFLSLSFLKKERETVLNKFPPNLQNLAENSSLHGCLIFYVHVIFAVWPLQKTQEVFAKVWIACLLFRRK